MKKTLLTLFAFFPALLFAQLGVKYDPSVQTTGNLQYFRPKGDLFVGDCMPFSHNGKYYFYWLLDSAHHRSLNGLGGHQWALSTSPDLKTWKQEPVVIGIDEEWEKSICTGSIVYYKGTFYAFYATRLINAEGNVNEQLSYATSSDGIHFAKQKPNPFYTSAPGYSKRDFRDPKVIVDEKTGEFHLFVSSWQENPVMRHAGGCLVHLTSTDLKNWKVHEPILTGQPSVPECPDYFFWKGWYYLVYSDNSNTYYVKSRKPYGPWEEPATQALNEQWSNVVKTAAFHNDRRIAAGWVPSRNNNKDNEHEIFGGQAIFRELIQFPDGTLGTKFPAEMIPASTGALTFKLTPAMLSTVTANTVQINAPDGVGAAKIAGIPARSRISFEVAPGSNLEEFGLMLRSDSKADIGYRLNLAPNAGVISLGNTQINAVTGLSKPVRLDVILYDDIIDVSIDGKRCIVNRMPEWKGDHVWFYGKHGKLAFKSIVIQTLQ
ncbi:MAG: family 43 glycosylhydrolase [Niastella sp.]|nr:family 43 glycosylhydrolase [Niastella sp.]